MKKSILVVVPVLISAIAFGDDDSLPANRPNFTSNAEVLPLNMTIFEMGTTYRRSGTDLSFSGIEGLIRFGFSKDWEFDFVVPNYFSGAAPRGFGDSGVNFIHQLPGCRGWHMVAAFGASLPSGQSDLTGGAINPSAYVSMDHDLSGGLGFTDTLYASWQNTSGSLIAGYANAAMVSKDYGGGIGGFAELNTSFAPGEMTTNTVHFGLTFAHTKDQQADFHFGRNISAGSDTNWFVGFGYARKLSK
jgi:hypothetical protein